MSAPIDFQIVLQTGKICLWQIFLYHLWVFHVAKAYPHVILLLATILLGPQSCKSRPPAIDRDYDFGRVHTIIIADVTDFSGQKGSGEIVANATARKLLRLGYKVMVREKKLTPIEELEFLQTTGYTAQIDEVAIIDVTISAYQHPVSQWIQVEKFQKGKITTTSWSEIIARDAEGKPITAPRSRTEHEGDKNERNSELRTIPARVALSLRMIEPKSGKVVWVSTASFTFDNAQQAAARAVADLIKPLSELTGRKDDEKFTSASTKR